MRINPIETFEQPECSLFAEIAKGNGLKQPTNSKFSAAKWIECFNNINEPTQDDERLLRSAIWIADRVQNLRDTFTQIVFNCDRSNLTKLIAAYTNSIHIIYSRKFHDFHESEYSKAGIVNVTSVTQQPMKAEAANQSIEPDHFFTSVIDSLPHILFHSMKANGKLKVVPFEGIQSLVLLGNLEVIFNDCWQKVLWEGFDIELEENLIRLVPPEERNLCWSLWEYRKSNLVIESLHAVGFGHFKHFEAADFSKHMPAYFPSSCKKVSNTRPC